MKHLSGCKKTCSDAKPAHLPPAELAVIDENVEGAGELAANPGRVGAIINNELTGESIGIHVGPP